MSNAVTKTCCDWILNNAEDMTGIRVKSYLIENILSGDKQVSALNAVFGRGVSVVARASIPESLMQTDLKVTSDKIINLCRVMQGNCQRSVMPSFIVGNIPNLVAAMFAAFGQDLGSVGECSQSSIFDVRKGSDDCLDVELKMPSLTIGTVGGGTALPTQSQCLAMVGCDGGPNSNRKLAEIMASVCLGAELSLLAALANNSHAASHERLGRNRPEDARSVRQKL